MKRIILSALAIIVMATAVQAQGKSPKKTPEQRAKFATDRMKKQCGLDEKQAIKVSAINFEAAKKIDELRAKRKTGEKEGLGKQFQAVEQQRMSQFNEVLTPEQMTCYKKMREDAKEKRKQQKGKVKSKTSKPEDKDDDMDDLTD